MRSTTHAPSGASRAILPPVHSPVQSGSAITASSRRPTLLHRFAPELQFWGYETGNVLASIAGIGGFAALATASVDGEAATAAQLATLLLTSPELAATLGIIGLVLAKFLVRACLSEAHAARGVTLRIDMGLMRLSLLLAAMAALWGANPMTMAAVSFASASALIRLTYHAPRFLKYGAGMLMMGGAFLVAFALSGAVLPLVAACLALNGFYVVMAAAIAYASGVAMEGRADISATDRALTWGAERIARRAIFWVPGHIKAAQPLTTSMWARLPWRVALALVVTVTAGPGAGALVLACLFWALGDIAFGAMEPREA